MCKNTAGVNALVLSDSELEEDESNSDYISVFFKKSNNSEQVEVTAQTDSDASSSANRTFHLSAWSKMENLEDTSVVELKGVMDYSKTPGFIGFQNLPSHECFSNFFPDEIYSHVANETNRCASSMLKK